MQKKVRIGIVGTGSFSKAHIQAVTDAYNAELVGLSDQDETRLYQHDEKFRLADIPHHLNYQEMLARDDVDAIIVSANDQAHCELTVAALKAGKPVLCEKPMALTTEECKAMIDAGKESGSMLMIGQVARFNPAAQKMIEIAKSGKLGEIFYVESDYAHDYSKIPGSTGWRRDPNRHGIIGGGCHSVDLLRCIAGNPEEVFAYSSNKVLTDWPVFDCTVATMKFPNGVLGRMFCSIGAKRPQVDRTVIYGTKGTLYKDAFGMYLYMEKVSDEPMFEGMNQQHIRVHIPVTNKGHNALAEVEEFCSAILEGRESSCPGVEGAITAYTCMAMVESSRTGLPVKMNYDFL